MAHVGPMPFPVELDVHCDTGLRQPHVILPDHRLVGRSSNCIGKGRPNHHSIGLGPRSLTSLAIKKYGERERGELQTILLRYPHACQLNYLEQAPLCDAKQKTDKS